MSASLERVRAALDAAGVDTEIRHVPAGARTAADAAAGVGCHVDQIVKSMVFRADDELVLALTSGGRSVDPDALAGLAGVERCGRADPDDVRTHTGFAIGGVAPVGHLRPVRTWFDRHLLEHDVLWIAAGTPRDVARISPADLLDVTGATVADFTA